MIIIDPETVVVFNSTELSTALSNNNGYKLIYLGDDITLQSGITINTNKTEIIIDGFYPLDGTGTIHTYTDMNSSGLADCIALRSPTAMDITIQNLNIVGRNYYGFPCIYAGSGYNNVSVTYKNITYNGPQMIFNPYGITTVLDSTINSVAGHSPMHEIGEVSRLIIGGNTTITHDSNSSATFYFRGTTGLSNMTILEEANVSISTTNYFMYSIDPVTYTIQPNASLSLISDHGISLGSGHRVSTFLVDQNANFHYTQITNNGTLASLYISGLLQLNNNSKFYMKADYNNNGALLYFVTTSAILELNNPKSFVIYSRNNTAIYSATTLPYSIICEQTNVWPTASLFPTAGTLDDIPSGRWYRVHGGVFTYSGRITSSNTYIDSHDLSSDDLAVLPPLSQLLLNSSRVIAIGYLHADVNPITEVGNPVTGITDPFANVKINYTVDSISYSNVAIATDTGKFTIYTSIQLPLETVVTFYANIPFLYYITTKNVVEEGYITIESAPEIINFIYDPIAISPVVLPREDPFDPVVIYDSRAIVTPWRLYITLQEPFSTAQGDVMPDAIVFADNFYNYTILTPDPTLVYNEIPDPTYSTRTNVFWELDKGVLLRITAPIKNNRRYSSRVTWTLIPYENE